MSKFEQDRRERELRRREKMSGFFYDLAKLIFGGLVLTVIVPLATNAETPAMWGVFTVGTLLTIASASLANNLMR